MEILVEAAVRATVLAAAVAVLLKGFHIQSPRVAHRAWAGVSVVMLLLPLLVAYGPEARVPVLPERLPVSAIDRGPLGAEEPGIAPPPAPAPPAQRAEAMNWERFILLIYGAGVAILLLRLAVGWRQGAALVRSARVVQGRLTHPRCFTPVTVGLRAPVVILPADWTEWPADALAAVLTHEHQHARQRDPLVIFVTLLNRAVFWFHPVAWWLPRHVAMLSEQACDAVVLSRGHDEHVYATALLKFAKAAASAGRRISPLGTTMPGVGLATRLRLLVTPPAQSTSTARLTSIAATYAAVVAICCAATLAETAATADDSRLAQRENAPARVAASQWRTHQTSHFDIFYRRDVEDRVNGVSQLAEAAYSQLSADFKYDLSARVALILLRSDSDLPIDGGPVGPTIAGGNEQRVVISLDYLDTRAGALVHELVHRFLFEIIPEASRLAPWLAEGLAEHARGLWDPDDFRTTREAVERGQIPSLDTVAAAERHWGHALAEFVTAQYGAEGMRRYLFALRTSTAPGAAVPIAFQIPLAEFDALYRAYLTRRFGGR